MAFAGSELWLPRELMKRLRDYVADGGRVAAFGADSFRREVTLRGDVASSPVAAPQARTRSASAPSWCARARPADGVRGRSRAVRGVSGFVGEFTVFETSLDLPRSGRRITAAGRDAGRPALLAIGLGGGIVLRAGTPQWARELEESALSLELPQVTKRIWRMLSQEGPRDAFAILRRVTRRPCWWEAGCS